MQPNDFVPVIRESDAISVFNQSFPRFMVSPIQKSFLSFVECSMTTTNYNKWMLNRALGFESPFHDFSSFDFYPGRQMGISTILSILPKVIPSTSRFNIKVITRNHQSINSVSHYSQLKESCPESITSVKSYIASKHIAVGKYSYKDILFVDCSRREFLKLAKIGPKLKDFSDFIQKYNIALIYFVGI